MASGHLTDEGDFLRLVAGPSTEGRFYESMHVELHRHFVDGLRDQYHHPRRKDDQEFLAARVGEFDRFVKGLQREIPAQFRSRLGVSASNVLHTLLANSASDKLETAFLVHLQNNSGQSLAFSQSIVGQVQWYAMPSGLAYLKVRSYQGGKYVDVEPLYSQVAARAEMEELAGGELPRQTLDYSPLGSPVVHSLCNRALAIGVAEVGDILEADPPEFSLADSKPAFIALWRVPGVAGFWSGHFDSEVGRIIVGARG